MVRTNGMLCVVLAVTALGGCGDDDDGSSSTSDDAGPSAGDGDGDGPASARPDASTTEPTDAGSSAGVTLAECRQDILAEGSAQCIDCLCGECPAQAVACDQDCWRTVRCILERCGGDAADTSCVGQRCSQDLTGAGAAMSLGRCINTCASSCTVGTETDGGSGDGDNDSGA